VSFDRPLALLALAAAVAGSLVAAFLLTFGGVVLVANFATPRPADGDNRPPSRSTSIVWQRPDSYGAPARLELAAMTANRAAMGEPMLIPAVARASASPSSEAATAAQVILATSGRPLALAPLLPRSHARYLLLRGLPPEAELSAGRRSGIGTWFVKDAEVADLSLSIGAAASGARNERSPELPLKTSTVAHRQSLSGARTSRSGAGRRVCRRKSLPLQGEHLRLAGRPGTGGNK